MVFFEYDKGLEILQIKKDKVREKILSSAYEEFSEFGYSGASLRRIAEKENMTKGVIYSYFDTKEELFKANIRPAIDFFDESFAENYIDKNSEYYQEVYLKDLLEKSIPKKNIKEFKKFVNRVCECRASLKLLLFCAGGSAYENYKEVIIKRYAESFYNMHSKLLKTDQNLLKTTMEMFVHTLASTYITMLEEIILHDPDKEELELYAEQMAVFVTSGVKQLMLYNFKPENL